LQRRPDIAQAEASCLPRMRSRCRARRLPAGIGLTGNGGYNGAQISNLIIQHLAWSIGASLLQSIFDGGG